MKTIHQKIWQRALPFLCKGKRKNFVLHTRDVIQAMQILLKSEKGDSDLLMPAAILHDVGWAKVPASLQKTMDRRQIRKAMRLHLEYGGPIAADILGNLGYAPKDIKKIVDIIMAHKFSHPRDFNKRLLIDADAVADAMKKGFAEDYQAYAVTPEANWRYRAKNEFYTKTARQIFRRELAKRKKEYLIKT